MSAIYQNPIFQDEGKAREALEAIRWPDGPICPHCGNSAQDKIAKLETKSVRPGLHYCNECKGQFTVTVGTVFERSKIPLTKWWMAARMLNSGKNGASAHEIHRQVGVTYKTAWFMMHRLREAMRDLAPAPMGGEGGAVQADETGMPSMRNLPEIRKIVKETLSGEYDHIRIVDVKVFEDLDADREVVLRVEVIFEGTPKEADAKKMTGAVRKLRPKLEQISEYAFPLLSFISKSDYAAAGRASA